MRSGPKRRSRAKWRRGWSVGGGAVWRPGSSRAGNASTCRRFTAGSTGSIESSVLSGDRRPKARRRPSQLTEVLIRTLTRTDFRPYPLCTQSEQRKGNEMKTPDLTTKALFFALTLGVFGLLLRPLAGPSAAAAEVPARTKQYLWGISNSYTAVAGNQVEGDWFGTSDEAGDHKNLGYQLDLDQIAQLASRQARKGWSVHSIGVINHGYYVLFEK
jgi:hypothetical protein